MRWPICSPTHRLATAGSKGIESLRGESLVVREAGSATRQATDQLLAALGIGSKTMMELGSQEAIKRVVMAGRGVGIVTKTGLEVELRSGLLTLARVPGLRSVLHLHVIYRQEKRLTSNQKAFLETLASDGLRPATLLELISPPA